MPRKTGPTSFPQFKKLPFEIQDQIWTLALRLDRPTAYFAKVSAPSRYYTFRALRELCPDKFALENTNVKTRFGYSRAASKPTESCVLDGGWSSLITGPFSFSEFHCLDEIRGRFSHQKIDSFRDLVILHRGWPLSDTELDVRDGEEVAGIQYLAVPWESMSLLWVFESLSTSPKCLNRVTKVFPGLQVLYLLVKPEETRRPQQKPWIDESSATLDEYVAACKETKHVKSNQVFECKDRLYQEVSVRRLAKLGGLDEPIRLLNQLRKDLESEGAEIEGSKDSRRRPALRIMSWRYVEGVTGRFD
ncbi:hypothetical protein ACJ41O_005452 [Fusarium nematophilum]